MSLTIFQGNEGCLFTLNNKKYIYAGLQKDKKGKELPTFYGLDGLDNNDKNSLINFNINNAINESKINRDGAVLKMVESAIYSEYKPGIPEKLRLAPGFPGPAAFYEIPGEDATPKRITSIPTKEEEKKMDKNLKYVHRVGSNGSSLKYIKEGKMNDIKKFINDYNKMKFMEKQNTDNQPKTAAIIEKKTWFSRSNTDIQPKPDKPDTPDSSLKPSYFSRVGSFMGRKGGRTKRYKKLKRSKTYKN